MWCFFRLSQSFKSFGSLAFWLCCRRSTADPPGSRSSIRKIKGATKGRTHWKLTGYCSRKQQRQQQLISPYNNETVTPLTSSMECSFSSAFSSAGIAAVVSPKCHECHDVSSLQRSDPPLTSIVAFGINCRAQEWCNLEEEGNMSNILKRHRWWGRWRCCRHDDKRNGCQRLTILTIISDIVSLWCVGWSVGGNMIGRRCCQGFFSRDGLRGACAVLLPASARYAHCL